MIDRAAYERSLAYLKETTGGQSPRVVLVLGSGLGQLAERFEVLKTVPYLDIPGFPLTNAPGHAGNLIFCRRGGLTLAVMQGRFHYYDGIELEPSVFPLRVLHMMGADTLLVTNAAGAVNTDFKPGQIMVMDDHIKLAPISPLRGENPDWLGPRFPDMTRAYDPGLRELAFRCAVGTGAELVHGVYVYTQGPQFETPAEIRAFRILGADAVGMSTVPEVIAAAHMGMHTLGLSLISNYAAGVTGEKLTHEEISEAGEAAKEGFSALIMNILEELDNGYTL